jgi:hypothetical protein
MLDVRFVDETLLDVGRRGDADILSARGEGASERGDTSRGKPIGM